ncbi:MAG: hypothetical protein WD972_02235 [Candidatus Andersenbacteria bacterium]
MQRWYIIGAAAGLLLVIFIGLWLWVLAINDPLTKGLATNVPWPIACSTRGCITTLAWHNQHERATSFATAAQQPTPSTTDSLTTLVRQHLIRHAAVTSPVTTAEARRYREEILNQKNEDFVKKVTSLSLDEYDEQVLVPFLQQEALRQSRKVESNDELFKQLAGERWIGIFPFSLGWDKATGSVTSN